MYYFYGSKSKLSFNWGIYFTDCGNWNLCCGCPDWLKLFFVSSHEVFGGPAVVEFSFLTVSGKLVSDDVGVGGAKLWLIPKGWYKGCGILCRQRIIKVLVV